MFTRCPECLTPQRITPVALRDGRGMVRCKRCSAMFDALATLAETEKLAVVDVHSYEETGSESKDRQQLIWRIGLPLGVVLLFVQLLYFEGGRALQNPTIRPALEKICGTLHCRLPDYQNPAELTILHNAFSQLPNRHYAFKLVLTNEAAFSIDGVRVFAVEHPGASHSTFSHFLPQKRPNYTCSLHCCQGAWVNIFMQHSAK
jgi:predicted Zn finger-like uncharacterized protein